MAVKYSLIDAGQKGFHEDHWGIRIDDGNLEGMSFQYDTVKIIPNEEDPNEGAVLEFNTITLEPPTNQDHGLTENEVRDILGDILVNIIMENLENENRTTDTESPAE
jgi:hypothetical protein